VDFICIAKQYSTVVLEDITSVCTTLRWNTFLDVASDVQRVASDPVRYVRENFSLARRSLEQLLDGARQPRGVVVNTLLLVLRAMAGVNEFLMGEFESSAETGSSSVLKDFSDTSSGTEADSSTPRALDFIAVSKIDRTGFFVGLRASFLHVAFLAAGSPYLAGGTFDSVGPHVRSKLQVHGFLDLTPKPHVCLT